MAAFFACAAAQAAEPPESQAPASALRQLEYGEFETAESALRPIAENGGVALSTKQDRLEALRAYGIASAMQRHRIAAVGAFMLLLDEKPTARLDPTTVPAAAVTLFESVREHHSPPPPPVQLRQPFSRQMKGGVALIVGGGLVGVAGLAIGLAGTSGQPTQSLFTKFDDIGTVSLILVQVSIPIAIVGGILLARGSRAQRLR